MILSIHTGRPIEPQQTDQRTALSTHTTQPARRTRQKQTAFLPRAQRLVARLRRLRRASTIDNYLTALRSLARFLHHVGQPEAQLSTTLVEQYDQWLQLSGVSRNTRSCYLRSLRALLRRLVGRSRGADAFATVFTGNAPTRKRALALTTLRRLRAIDLASNSALSLSRDVFIFSVFALGMPFADVALLRWRDLRGGYFVYHRRKTGVEVRVRLEPCMREIAERWRSRGSDRVFPLLPEGLTGPRRERAYHSALSRYNAHLHQLATRLRLHGSLSSYTARHTWATMAHTHGMDLPLISTAMGHRSVQTTMVYIARKEHTRVAQMNKKVLESICGDSVGVRKQPPSRGHTYCKEVQPEGQRSASR